MRNLILILLLVPFLMGAASLNIGGRVDFNDILDVTTGDVSICIWAKTTEDASSDALIGKTEAVTASVNAGYQLWQLSTDVVRCEAADGTVGRESTGTTDIDGSWHWLCCSWDGTSDITTIYVDNIQEDSDDSAATGSLSTTADFNSGTSGASGTDSNALMAYGLQFSRLLNVVERAELMWKPESIIDSRGILYPMWGDATEIDLGSNDFAGTVTGATTSQDGPPVFFGGIPL